MEKKALKDAILKSSLVFFKDAPFQKVSTNDIVTHAGVSKGLLFHYFKDKRTLYITLYEHVWEHIKHAVLRDEKMSDPNLFVRLNHFFFSQRAYLMHHSDHALFLKRVHLTSDEAIAKKRNQAYQTIQNQFYKRIFDGIDTTLFKAEINLNDAYKVLVWTLQRVVSDWEKNHKETSTDEALNALGQELEHYLTFFEQLFLK